MRCAAAIAFILVVASCATRDAPEQPRPVATTPDLSPWSRAAHDDAGAPMSDAGIVPPSSPDPAALDEFLHEAPKNLPRATGDDGKTKVGTDTGAPADSTPPPIDHPPEPSHKPKVSVGTPNVQAEMSNPAIERAARAQLYYILVTRCRDKDKKILPHDTVHLKFTVDGDGYIVAPTIIITPTNPIYDEAANCMRRELSTATFRAPAATRGTPVGVDMTVPSVD